jgi:PmbA protein
MEERIMDSKALAEQLVQTCLKRGADSAEVFLETGRELSIEVRKGEIETVQEAASQGIGFRIFAKGRMAFASCNDLSDTATASAIESAIRFAQQTTADPNNVLPDDKGLASVDGLYDPQIAKIPMEQKIELAKTVEKMAMQDSRITKSSGAGYSESESEVFIANSSGLSKTYKSSGCSFGVSVVAEKGEQKSSGGESCTRRFYADLKPPADIAAKAARKAYELLDPRMVKTQRASVVFDPDVAGAILGGILAAVNGERVLQEASFLGTRLNQKVASALVTLIDDGTRARGLASAPFDGEGVPTQKRAIIDRGILKGFMYNTIIARRARVRSTGNASRGGFASVPGIGAHNFYMAAGSSSRAEILAGTDRGLLLTEVTGYGINPVNGDFSGGASGFWIEAGKIAFPVKGLTIAGRADEILNGIDLVGNDFDWNRRTTAPTFRIREMQIGGE